MFAYRLARELGYANVDKMLATMTSKQFAEWQAACRIDFEEQEEKNMAMSVRAKMKAPIDYG